MKISIVDTLPVLATSTAVEAFLTTIELAQLADQAGFSRYWLQTAPRPNKRRHYARGCPGRRGAKNDAVIKT
jgi:alkanesulfonate monooxygenase SsuD/methylene tetrahydromethanopterin reductase-like flavin-dependent oxidoreductase (luciferase family)